MFEIPVLNKTNLDKEPILDIENLPDIDEGYSNNFLDIRRDEETQKKMERKELMDVPKDGFKFKDKVVTRTDNKIRIQFKVGREDVNKITQLSFGLLSTEVNTGEFIFDIDVLEDGHEELYYYGEFVGEIVKDDPRIYRRYFLIAVVRSMVKQEILYEYEKNKFTVHPIFFLKLKVNNVAVAEALQKKGFKVIDEKQFKEIKEFEEKARAIAEEKIKQREKAKKK